MKKSLQLAILLLFITANCFSQFSKTHYIPPLSNSDSQDPLGQYMYISCPSVTPISFQIQEIGGSVINGTVSRDNPYVHQIGTGPGSQILISDSEVNTVKNNKGYIVQAQDLVYVNVRLTASTDFQAGGLVSKGSAALGTVFRIGAFINTGVASTSSNHYTFASILATENNTTVSFGDIKTGVQLINNAAAGNNPTPITLQAGESFVIAVKGPTNANRDGLIGASIISDKPIAVNCGSFAGSNGTTTNLDLGMDQIVSAERTGSEYIFIKGDGVDVTERPLIVANENGTQVFLNGSATPFTTLNAGQYLALTGADFSANENLYVQTSKNVFAYQGIGGSSSQANQNMHFVPPLSCQTPKSINNIPLLNEVGALQSFIGTVCVVTKTNATLTFTINGNNYTLATLPGSIGVTGPLSVTGNPNYVTYTFSGLTGNISVYSTEQVYLSYYGSSGAATYGGFYSGFTFKPEIVFESTVSTQANCIPNINLEVNSISNFDVYQWYFNGNPIVGATSNSYVPTAPGYYKIKASLTECGIDYFSDEIPVSSCSNDIDTDGINDNIDNDIDNDGILNCTESYGNQTISLANTAAGSVSVGTYSSTFTGAITTSTTASAVPFIGNADGSFITDVPAGRTNWVQYELNFTQPITLGLEYVTTANASDLLNSNAEYIVNSETNRSITVLNPNNQLLIDTNYDGIFETGITQYSSFEIRFRINSATLAAGTGTFKFIVHDANMIKIKHKNLIDTAPNKSTFKIKALCVSNDSDGDGVSDQNDLDSDNDGILDVVESQGVNYVALSGVDNNLDGVDDVFSASFLPADTDNDGVLNYLDLDSDNDGIYDLNESGSNAVDTNLDGIIDLGSSSFGTNGLYDLLETSPDNSVINYTLANTDATLFDYVDLDSDADGCNDVVEAGFLDSNFDGILGANTPPTVDVKGLVTSGVGYTIPHPNYITSAPIIIDQQPIDSASCESQQTITFEVQASNITSFQWEVSVDGGTTWTALVNNALYLGVAQNILSVVNATPSMLGYKYRVLLNRTGNSCNVYSNIATLSIYSLPVIAPSITMVQCDDDTDLISSFNLTQKNPTISANFSNETFTYYFTQLGAETENPAELITNPVAFSTSDTTVYARVENINGCYSISAIQLIVSFTQIPSSFHIDDIVECDDFIDAINDDYDGISLFDFSYVTQLILDELPTTGNYNINYYKTEADYQAETDINGNSLAIPATDYANYRNIGFPNTQTIWARVESNTTNDCYGITKFNLVVEPKPIIHNVGVNNVIRGCDSNNDGDLIFNTSQLESNLLNGQTNKILEYTDQLGNAIPSPFPATYQVINTATIFVKMINDTDQQCFETGSFQFVVDSTPIIYSLAPGTLTKCDDESDPRLQDGIITFDTSQLETLLLQGQTGLEITYTSENGTVLSSPLPPLFTTTTQNVLMTVKNPLNPNCIAQTTLQFIVNELPNIDLNLDGHDTALVCKNLPDYYVNITAGDFIGHPFNIFSFQWYLNGVILPGKTTYNINVNKPGTYTVVVTNSAGCSRTRTIVVTESEIATITSVDITDFTNNNTATINVTGMGTYVYSIGEEYGAYQTSNFFDNLPMGFHQVYVRDEKGCGTREELISVLGVPQFFTPNGDGINDYWNVKGANARYSSKIVITIFDRTGKFIKQISPSEFGWDGTYQNEKLPSDDYWYSMVLENGIIYKGHFSLKR